MPHALGTEDSRPLLKVAVSIHPSSVNAKATRFESRYLVYAEMVKTTQVGSRE